jgi:CheY-like chemotaxis protein
MVKPADKKPGKKAEVKDKVIVVVDDEPEVIKIITSILDRHGYPVFSVLSARETLEYLKDHDAPLVITDVKMPGMNGRELLDKIKEQHRNTKVVVMDEEENSDLEFKLRGAVDLLPKPVDFTQLLDIAHDQLYKDKRITIRYPLQAPVIVDNRIFGTGCDISADGMQVLTEQPISAEGTVELIVQFPVREKYLYVYGNLVRTIKVENGYMSAFYFLTNIGTQLAGYIQDIAAAD